MYISFCSPRVFGRRCFIEFNGASVPPSILHWIEEGDSVLIWVWRLHIVISREGNSRRK